MKVETWIFVATTAFFVLMTPVYWVATAQGNYLDGNGELIEPDDGILAIGSGGSFALAAARALARETSLPPVEIVKRAMTIAGEICVYTNTQITVVEPSA